MQTATFKEATEKLGVSPDDRVRYYTLGNSAIIHVDLAHAQPAAGGNSKPAKHEKALTPEEEFRQKYPNIKVNRPELFELVGCMADVPPDVSDKDLIIDAIESKYRDK